MGPSVGRASNVARGALPAHAERPRWSRVVTLTLNSHRGRSLQPRVLHPITRGWYQPLARGLPLCVAPLAAASATTTNGGLDGYPSSAPARRAASSQAGLLHTSVGAGIESPQFQHVSWSSAMIFRLSLYGTSFRTARTRTTTATITTIITVTWMPPMPPPTPWLPVRPARDTRRR
jgi:hypothetical protein